MKIVTSTTTLEYIMKKWSIEDEKIQSILNDVIDNSKIIKGKEDK